jgi:hypothetical protein
LSASAPGPPAGVVVVLLFAAQALARSDAATMRA